MGLGCSFWPPSIALCYPLSVELTRSQSSWPLYTQSDGPITLCAARQARSAGLQPLTACRASESCIDVLKERYSTESRHSYIGLEALLCRSPHSFRHHFRLPPCNWCWRNALSLHCVCAVFRHGTGVPLCSTGLPRICVRQAVRDKHVVGAHAGACSGFWRCGDVYRVAGVARLQEIRTACAFRFVTLFGSEKTVDSTSSTTTAASNFE